MTHHAKPSWPLGFLTIDLDGLWALRQCYVQPPGNSFENDPVWLDGVPWMLDALDRFGLKATFFVVARDLEVEAKRALAAEILKRGHEIGNHSLAHRIGLTRLPMGVILDDLRGAQRLFEEALGTRPIGFRAPGYDVDARLLRAVRRCGFAYDSSLLPTWWGPALRMADWMVARRIQFGKRQFGRVAYGRAPLAPYCPDRFRLRKTSDRSDKSDSSDTPETSDFWEFPISVTPRWRVPVGAGYVLSAGFSHLERGLAGLRRRGLPVNYLIHGADFTDLSRGASRVFPRRFRQPRAAAFALSGAKKRRVISKILERLADNLNVVRLCDWVGRQDAP